MTMDQTETVASEETAPVEAVNPAEETQETAPEATSPETAETDGEQTHLLETKVEGTDETAEGEGESEGDQASQAELELSFPEGVEVDEEMLTAFTPLAQEYGLDSEKAQPLVDLYVQGLERAREHFESERIAQSEAWAEETKKTLGKDLDSSLYNAKRAIEKFGNDGLVEVLRNTGAGNHPEVVAFVSAIGKALGEDSIAGATGGPTTGSEEERVMRDLFPTMFSD